MATYKIVAGNGGKLVESFVLNGEIRFGPEKIGDLRRFWNLEALRTEYNQHYEPSAHACGMAYRFVKTLKVGDNVVTYDPSLRTYSIGKILSDCEYEPSGNPELPNRRKVQWIKTVRRDGLSPATKNSLGSVLWLFRVPEEAVEELSRAVDTGSPYGPEAEAGGIGNQHEVPEMPGNEAEAPSEPSTVSEMELDFKAKSIEFIKDRVVRLDPYQMQDLVAALLRAMGYRTRVSPPGPDGGRDIVATRDGFGFVDPTVIVEVKHRIQSVGREPIQKLAGAMRAWQKGLFVSTGGFHRNAYSEVENMNDRHIVLVDLDELTRLIVETYEEFDDEGRNLLPLTRIYWPEG